MFRVPRTKAKDIKVPLIYEDLLNGNDTQLDEAVKEMLKEIAKK